MPSSYVDIDREEMEYVDGGGTLRMKISKNSLIIHLLSAIGGALTSAKFQQLWQVLE